jgi:uncharacterized membrane protein YgaE (UPF0421/DUF939 family)
MNKKLGILSSLLLIAAGVVLIILSDQTDGAMDMELIDFFAGVLVGAGISILLITLFKKPEKNLN